MAVNSPYVTPYQPNNYVSPQQVISERVWVQGENAGKSYLVSKNREQVLWDSESPVIYIKTVDAFGRPSMVTLDYTIRQVEQPQSPESHEISELKAEFEDLKKQLTDFMSGNQNKQYKPNYRKENQKND